MRPVRRLTQIIHEAYDLARMLYAIDADRVPLEWILVKMLL